MIQWLKKHWEVLSYLIFGVLTTLLNILLYALFNRLFGYTAANSWGNVLDNILCILFAYATNRAFVFRSKTRGREQAKEFTAFVSCRLGTMLLDTVIVLVLGNLLAAQGAALYVTNTEAYICITDSAEVLGGSGVAVKAAAGQWGSSGNNGGRLVLRSDGAMEGAIEYDSLSSVETVPAEETEANAKTP